MASARTTIRGLFLTKLQAAAVTGQPLDGYTIESSRVTPVDDAEMGLPLAPFIQLYAPDAVGTAIESGYGSNYAASDTVTVVLNCSLAQTGATGATLEAEIDTLEETLRTVLLGDRTFLDALRGHPRVDAATAAGRLTPAGRLRGFLVMTFTCDSFTVEVP
jgi:hypothetical protein